MELRDRIRRLINLSGCLIQIRGGSIAYVSARCL